MARNPNSNRLLAGLPERERARVLGRCEAVSLCTGEILARPGDLIHWAYFPVGGLISLMGPMDSGSIVEVSMAGSDGFYGMPVALGATLSPVHAVVQAEGRAMRIGADDLRGELAAMPALRTRLGLYIHVVMAQLVRSAGCNRFHVIEQRVARWLLVASDNTRDDTFAVTHEALARMLGVRRVGVTEAASGLQRRGLIGYTRGIVTITDRKGLERASCSCYRCDRQTYKRILG
jgi:CRP-like cAMP-binding protein